MAKAKELGDDERLVYAIDWATWLGTDTIQTSAWKVPAELTSLEQLATTTAASIKLELSGTAVAGQTYEFTNVITTATSDEDREITIKIKAVTDKYK